MLVNIRQTCIGARPLGCSNVQMRGAASEKPALDHIRHFCRLKAALLCLRFCRRFTNALSGAMASLVSQELWQQGKSISGLQGGERANEDAGWHVAVW